MTRALLVAIGAAGCVTGQPDRAPAPERAMVQIMYGNAPAAGVHVLASRATGELIAHLSTDVNGRAEAHFSNGSITIATYDKQLGSHELFTIAGVEAGATVLVDLQAYALPEPAGVATVALPARVPGAASYQAVAGCSGGSSRDPRKLPPLRIQPWCLDGGRFDVSARAVDASGHPVAYTFAADLTPGASPSIALPPWRTDFSFIQVSVVHAPPDAKIAMTVDAVGREITARADAVSGPFPQTLRVFTSLAERIDLTVTEEAPDGRRAISRLHARTSSIVFDARDLLPRLGLQLDPQRLEAHLAIEESPRGADAIWAGMSWGEPKPKINWTFLLPPVAKSFGVLELPPALSEFAPSGRPRLVIATLFDRASIAAWPQVRARPTDSMRWAVNRSPSDTMLRFSQSRR